MKVKLVLGDWSQDGHSKYKEIVLESNKTIFEIQEAYKASCKLTGLQFNHNENYTGLPEHNKYDTHRHICTDYEVSCLSEFAYQILKDFIPNIDDLIDDNDFSDDEVYLSKGDYTRIWIAFVKLSLPDLELEMVNDDIPTINGFWDKNLNVQFGYGLF